MDEQEYRRQLAEIKQRAIALYDRSMTFTGTDAAEAREILKELVLEAIPELEQDTDIQPNAVTNIIRILNVLEIRL